MYIGRFAPTTSGALHLGSLLTAVASYLDAKAHNGQWLLRLDDIDVPRNAADGEKLVLDTLEAHHLYWDGSLSRQTDHQEAYDDALSQLHQLGLLFYCTCTRRELRQHTVYPGTCRWRKAPPTEPATIRVHAQGKFTEFVDRIQRPISYHTMPCVDDFSIRRKEGIVSYPLAVVVDDEVTGITDVVRGADLLENTLAQLFLIENLGYRQPTYAHLPILNQKGGIKLSKRDKAVAIDSKFANLNVSSALQLLGLDVPSTDDLDSLLNWAIDAWDIDSVPKAQSFNQFTSI